MPCLILYIYICIYIYVCGIYVCVCAYCIPSYIYILRHKSCILRHKVRPCFLKGNTVPGLGGSTVEFVYRVKVITTRDGGVEEVLAATARMSLSVNLPPSSGSCEVSPVEGFGLETDFSLSCHGWKDEGNSAISYEFVAVTPNGNINLQPRTPNRYELLAFNMPNPPVKS
jgi:hypothetical protein